MTENNKTIEKFIEKLEYFIEKSNYSCNYIDKFDDFKDDLQKIIKDFKKIGETIIKGYCKECKTEIIDETEAIEQNYLCKFCINKEFNAFRCGFPSFFCEINNYRLYVEQLLVDKIIPKNNSTHQALILLDYQLINLTKHLSLIERLLD